MRRLFFFLGTCGSFLLLGSHVASAATLSIIADRGTASVGDVITASIRIDSEGQSINAAQATLTYPKDLVEATEIDSNDSIFDFWLDRPGKSDNTGRVSFIGGSSDGFNGKSLHVMQVKFKVKGNGPITLQLADAAVSANDGNGTNVLFNVRSAFITSQPGSATTAVTPPPATSSTVLTVTPPVQIIRKPVPALVTVATPKLQVSLYPDPEQWYAAQENFLVRWELPLDVSDVAAVFDQSPATNPSTSQGLFDNKVFPAPKDGVSYLHVRFKNSQGWGKTLSYRIAVDTIPPASFKTLIEEGSPTDNPRPTISYKTTDPISPLKNYTIHIDSQDPIVTNQERYTLPVLLPGKHQIRVSAFDQAGNSTDASIDVVVNALPSPVFGNINPEAYVGEGGLDISGGSSPSSTVVLALKTAAGELVETETAQADEKGNWHLVFQYPLSKGSYYIEAFVRDARGATSLVIQSGDILVRARPFLVISGYEVTETIFFSTIILILLVGFLIGWFTNALQKRQRKFGAIISERDISSAMEAVADDTDKILKKFKKSRMSESDIVESKELLQRLNKRAKKMRDYLIRGVEELNK